MSNKDLTPKHIILVGWDGVRRQHLKDCLKRNELPNLKKLSDEGTIVEIDILRETETCPGWAQILTGYNPETTGNFSNTCYQPIPVGLTVFERLEEFFGRENICTSSLSGGKGAYVSADEPRRIVIEEALTEAKRKDLLKIEGSEIVEEDGKCYHCVPGKPLYNAKQTMTLYLDRQLESEIVTNKAMELIEQNKDRNLFIFLHFLDPDKNGHKYGEASKEYNDALITCDHWTGVLINKIKELGLYDDTIIYVTSDHGFDVGKKSHRDAPYVFLATNDKKVIRRGERADITPTILDRFGVDISKIEPPLDGYPLTRPFEFPKW